MEYQKIINLLDNTPNQPSKFRTRKWVEINDDSRGRYNTNSQIKFKTSVLKSCLCDYSDAYILVKGNITITGDAGPPARRTDAQLAAARGTDESKEVTFKTCAPFTCCTSEINNTQKDNAKDVDAVMPIYYLIEYTDNYSKISVSLW